MNVYSGSAIPAFRCHVTLLELVNTLLGGEMVNRLTRLGNDVILNQWKGCQVTCVDVVAMRRAAKTSFSSSRDNGVRELVARQCFCKHGDDATVVAIT
jgi:hypothetical protein